MQETHINQQLTETNKQFVHVFSSFENLQVNQVPFTESWTPAQVTQHVLKSEMIVLQALRASGKKVDRKPDERVPELKKIFLDFSIKMKSPGFIIPEEKEYDKDDLIHQLNTVAVQLAQTIEIVEKDEAVTDPALGELTKEEMIYFLTYHTQRHIHQLQHISETFNDKTKAMRATKEVIVRNVNDAFRRNNMPAFLSYCTDDIVWNMVGNAVTQGKEAIRQMMCVSTAECPDITLDTVFSDDDKTACTGAFTMTNKEGGRTRYSFCDIYHFAGEKIQALDSYVVEIKQ